MVRAARLAMFGPQATRVMYISCEVDVCLELHVDGLILIGVRNDHQGSGSDI